MPAWFAPALLQAGLSAGVGAAGTAMQGAQGKKAQKRQHAYNMQLAQFQASANERYLQQQLDYNTPANQMARFQDAGLNPHLVYGQGTPGNQQAPLTYPDIQPASFDYLMSLVPTFNQTALAASQVQATNAQTLQRTAATEVSKIQKEVLKRNPLLDDTAFKAIITSLEATARSKEATSRVEDMISNYQRGLTDMSRTKDGTGLPPAIYRMEQELDLLEQRFGLGNADAAIKAQIVETKEFQNYMLELEKRFLSDNEWTGKHIYQFLTLFMMKFFHAQTK